MLNDRKGSAKEYADAKRRGEYREQRAFLFAPLHILSLRRVALHRVRVVLSGVSLHLVYIIIFLLSARCRRRRAAHTAKAHAVFDFRSAILTKHLFCFLPCLSLYPLPYAFIFPLR